MLAWNIMEEQASELRRARLLQRGDLCRGAEEDHSKGRSGKMGQTSRAGSYQHRGQRDLRLGTGESLKPGQAKRIRGQWLRSAKLMEAEHEVYHSQPSTRQRPPPSVDLWELFAGQARCSELAHEYDLTALQPMDIVYCQDFFDQKVRSRAKETLDRLRPTLLMIETDCTHFTLFNKNLNYSQRLDEWHRLQQEDQPLVTFSTTMATRQHQAGGFFLLENPLKSELWQQTQVVRLASLPGVYSFVLDSGAFGGQVQGHDIIKPFKIMTDFPGLRDVLERRLTPEERSNCTPIEGSLTSGSQAYPEQMCRAILGHLRECVKTQQPARFCLYSQVLPVQLPTDDLSQWDEIVEHVAKTFERSSRRPFIMQPESELGRKIQDLFRIDAIKIQAVSAPTTRRIPSNVDEYYTRAAFLFYNDETKAVEVEDLGDLQFPRQRFSKPVRYGHRRLQPEPSASTTQSRTPTMVLNLPTDIDFPDLSKDVPQEVRSAAARLHLNLGHPSRQELNTLLAYEGNFPDAVYECAWKLRCSTCERLKPKQPPRPTAQPSMVVGQFGDELQMDIYSTARLWHLRLSWFWAWWIVQLDSIKQSFCLTGILRQHLIALRRFGCAPLVCHFTCRATPIKASEEVLKAGSRQWVASFSIALQRHTMSLGWWSEETLYYASSSKNSSTSLQPQQWTNAAHYSLLLAMQSTRVFTPMVVRLIKPSLADNLDC